MYRTRRTHASAMWIALAGTLAVSAHALAADLTASERAMLDRISPDSMRGHLSFIASDLLEGRDTPSRGLDIAAQYIAAQFTRAGLEPIGDDGYFQTSSVEQARPSRDDLQVAIRVGGAAFNIDLDRATVQFADAAINVTDMPTLAVPFPLDDVERKVEGPFVAVVSMPSQGSVPREEVRAFFAQYSAYMNAVSELGAVAVLNFDPSEERGGGTNRGGRSFGRGGWPPVFQVHGAAIAEAVLPAGAAPNSARVDLAYRMPALIDVPVRNVVGMIRGSDPELSEEYIIVTAHYDHVGIGSPVEGDSIYNGANDDGSGTTCVIEIAAAMASLDPAPRRSIIFMCVYGEERGLLGSRHYVANPLVPLRQTIANINLEHMGRTDDSEGPSVNRVMPTGFDYSSAIEPFVEAGNAIGFDVDHHPLNSANFFARSDNVAFARVGIPAHTFCTAFIFPDYHGAGDHWELIDYNNMAAAAKMTALGLKKLAERPEAPRWTEGHRATGRYVEAWQALRNSAEED